jgi:hypothetical protein
VYVLDLSSCKYWTLVRVQYIPYNVYVLDLSSSSVGSSIMMTPSLGGVNVDSGQSVMTSTSSFRLGVLASETQNTLERCRGNSFYAGARF